jgi:hypothetical protein
MKNLELLFICSIATIVSTGSTQPVFGMPEDDLEGMVDMSRERRVQRLTSFVPSRLDYFDEKGIWIGPEQIAPRRALEPLALSHALLADGRPEAVEQANRYLSNTELLEWHRGTYVYLKFHDLLSSEARANMRAIIDRIASEYLDPSWDFVGINDNFPSMATAGCALYWQISGDEQHRATAERRMVEFGEQLTRSGAQTEYSSQAYAFLQIEPMAMLAELTPDARLRELALKIEERLWFDTLMHVYLPAQKMTGPYSRGYMWDFRGVGLAYGLLDSVLGDHFVDLDLDDYFDGSEEWIIGRNAACYGIEYHCPRSLVEAVIGRSYPFRFLATADGGPSSDDGELALVGLSSPTRTTDQDDGVEEYGAWSTRIETYMTEHYSLGSSLVPYHSGAQTENFLAVYRNGDHPRDVSTVFSRLVINDEMTLSAETDGYGDQGIVFNEWGRKIVVQDKNKALVSYMPKLGFRKRIRSLKTCVFFPNERWATGEPPFEEVWIGDSQSKISRDLDLGRAPVCFRDGRVFMAVIPWSDSPRMELENRNGYTILSFTHYEGEEKTFTRRSFASKGGGFAFVIASPAEYETFALFREVVAETTAVSRYRNNVHYRQNPTRILEFSFDGETLKMEYSPASEGIRYVTINGRPQERPLLEVTGFRVEDLPFLGR